MEGKYVEASAPGRLDVMGGIADYSGSLVLQMPIKERTYVKLQLRSDYKYSITSQSSGEQSLFAEGDYRSLLNNGEVDFAFAHHRLSQTNSAWTAYVIGCALVLQRKKGIDFKGATISIQSTIPLGKGVSSSAALEVATMRALAEAFNISFEGTELPIRAQQVENNIVGAPCGLMDQLACYFGQPGKLLPIVCQPDLVQEPIAIPSDIHFIGIDSGLRHQVSGVSYGDVRTAAFMGYSIIAKELGVSRSVLLKASESGDFSQLPYQGYLANVTIAEYEEKFKTVFPEFISGKDFISSYGLTIDPLLTVDEFKTYHIQACASHPIYENDRVIQFAEHLKLLNKSTLAERSNLIQSMGELMYQSHESYSRCGLGSTLTDELVCYSHQYKNIVGAKITGGGSGGTVCYLAIGDEGRKEVNKIHREYQLKHNASVVLFE